MASLDARLARLEKSGATPRLQVIVVRRHETHAQAQMRMGHPAFIVFVPEKDAPDLADGGES